MNEWMRSVEFPYMYISAMRFESAITKLFFLVTKFQISLFIVTKFIPYLIGLE